MKRREKPLYSWGHQKVLFTMVLGTWELCCLGQILWLAFALLVFSCKASHSDTPDQVEYKVHLIRCICRVFLIVSGWRKVEFYHRRLSQDWVQFEVDLEYREILVSPQSRVGKPQHKSRAKTLTYLPT
jgi:hypothetical protein